MTDTTVTNEERIAVALAKISQAELLLSQATKILSWADKIDKGTAPPPEKCQLPLNPATGLYPGQLPNMDETIPDNSIGGNEEEEEECSS